MGNDGRVYFQATLANEGAAIGVVDGEGGPLKLVLETPRSKLRTIVSHPAVSEDGSVTFYAEDGSGDRGAYVVRSSLLERIVGSDGPIRDVGPLGPTTNAQGAMAFRAGSLDRQSVFVASDKTVARIDDTQGEIAAFQGLPVVTDDETVVYRADLRSGHEAIYASRNGARRLVVDTRGRCRSLGRFPSANRAGRIVFCADLDDGSSAVFVDEGEPIPLVSSTSGFESIRGALVDSAGRVVFLATPRSGRLAIFTGPHAVDDKVLGLGDALFGSIVTELATNPVSMNAAGQLAIRVLLADGRHLIVRADPD